LSKNLLPWLTASLIAAVLGVPIAFSTSWGGFVLIALLFTVIFGAIASAMRTEADHDWLLKWVALGFVAKIVGTLARHYMVAVMYGGGDSFRYYRVGTEIAAQFHLGRVPEFAEPGAAFGTRVLEFFTGGVLTVFSTDMLGGFLVFSMFAFGGQLLFYAAFRRWADSWQLKPYAFFVLFLPTYAFWPSSIGKDAIVIFAAGGAAYFISRILETYEVRWLLGLAVFLTMLGLIRIHVAGLVVAGLIGAGVLARMRPNVGATARLRRLLVLGGFVAAGGLVLTLFPDVFGVDLTGANSLDAFTSDVVRRTSEAGTVASGGAVTSPAQIPDAIALVLFRPFAFEASELQHFFAAAETTLLLALTIWKLPAILGNWRAWRANAYIVFCTMYVLVYSVAFSVVRNLGIVARQRGQVLAFFLCVLVGLGWRKKEDHKGYPRLTPVGRPSSTPQPPRRSAAPARVR
jgi:hypothetical protein